MVSKQKLRNLSPAKLADITSLVNTTDLYVVQDKLIDMLRSSPQKVPDYVLETANYKDWYVMPDGRRLNLPDHQYK